VFHWNEINNGWHVGKFGEFSAEMVLGKSGNKWATF
jgi:hypothetical protein